MTEETTNEPDFTESGADAVEESPTNEDAGAVASPAELQAKIDRLQDQLLRGQAELENFRRRSHREADEARKYQSLPFVRDLLPAMDNLDRAIQAAEQTGDAADGDDAARFPLHHSGGNLAAAEHSSQQVTVHHTLQIGQ